jgi:hypothetical protein
LLGNNRRCTTSQHDYEIGAYVSQTISGIKWKLPGRQYFDKLEVLYKVCSPNLGGSRIQAGDVADTGHSPALVWRPQDRKSPRVSSRRCAASIPPPSTMPTHHSDEVIARWSFCMRCCNHAADAGYAQLHNLLLQCCDGPRRSRNLCRSQPGACQSCAPGPKKLSS